MTPKLTRLSRTALTLAFPADAESDETAYAIEYDAFYANWKISPEMPSALMGVGRTLADIIEQLIAYENVRRDNLRRADIDLQIVTAQEYINETARQ